MIETGADTAAERRKPSLRSGLMMLYSTWTVFRPVEVLVVVVFVLSWLDVAVTTCPGSDHDYSIQTCVEDLVLDVESRRTIDALRSHYYDFPTYCRYG